MTIILSLAAMSIVSAALIAAGLRRTTRQPVRVDCAMPGNSNRNYNDGGRWHGTNH
jgi:hypothetical protein